jgi:hypothetical protein
VRWVSYDDAAAFADWAGAHLPTEEEWEYAARGPSASRYPWGNEWADARCNTGGRVVHDAPEDAGTRRHLRPRLVDAFDPRYADGRSWCGAWNLIGNVGEWTSSWFDRYPGTSPKLDHKNLGRYVKVIRGGTSIDEDPLAVRSASRNFVGRGPEAPPIPSNRFEYVGVRLARHVAPGRSAIVEPVRRVAAALRVPETEFPVETAAGIVALGDVVDGAVVADGVFARERARAVALAPRASLLAADADETRIRSVADLLERSETEPLVLAALRSDVPLLGWRRTVGEGRRRKDDRFDEARQEPDAFLLCVSRRRLLLASPALDEALWLERETLDETKRAVLRPPGGDAERRAASLQADAATDRVTMTFRVPIGGHARSGNAGFLEVSATLATAPGSLRAAGLAR